jgi:RNA polymerase sigma factor for flagellar operon FliA
MGITREHWREYRRTKDPGLRERLITENLAFVRQVAGRLALHLPRHLEFSELESAGIVGLLSAVESYDPEQPAEFATFAQHRIRGAILDDLRSQDLAPRSLRAKARQIEQAFLELERVLGRQPTDDEMADALGMDRDRYHDQLGEVHGLVMVSLDDPGTEADGPSGVRFHTALPDSELQDPFLVTAKREQVQLLGEIIDALPDQERLVLTLYYVEELTMKEIGRVLRVSESRISQIHTSAILRMRARLLKRKLQAADLLLGGSVRFTARDLVLALLLSLGWLLAGCAAPRAPSVRPSVVIPREAPLVIVPASSTTEDRPLSEAIARLFVLEMSSSGRDVRGPDWLRGQLRARGWDPTLTPLKELVTQRGEGSGRPGIDWQALGLSRALIVSVFDVDQHWEGAAKVTRVGVEAQLVALPGGDQLWAGRIAPASTGTTGWSFEQAAHVAVRKLADSLR